MGTKPLDGITVLDLTNVLAGPFCCYQLALLGAETIKVERPGSGDLARQLGADPARNAANMGISFLAQNAGKKSLTLDLKTKAGIEILKRLVERADVLVENFRPGVMARLGIGYDALKAINPSLIYCAISGYGQNGPLKNDPAYDQIIQGMSGVMSITGESSSAPLRVGYPIADTIGGMTAAFAISAALNEKPRGAVLDVSMTEAVISTMGWVVSNHLIGGVEPQALGNENMTSAPSGTFRTADAPINIAANRDTQWESLVRHLGRDELLADPAFATREDRKTNRLALRDQLEITLMTRKAREWVEELSALGIPCGLVMTVPEILREPQIMQRGLVGQTIVEDETHQILNAPVLIDGERASAEIPPPILGADTDAILSQLGYEGDQISKFRNEGVI